MYSVIQTSEIIMASCKLLFIYKYLSLSEHFMVAINYICRDSNPVIEPIDHSMI